MSVSGSSTAYLSKNSGLPSATSSWTWHIWIKAAGYPAGALVAYNKTGGSDEYSGFDSGGTTVYNAYVYDTVVGNGANASIITGSYTGWVFIACRHVGGTTAYDYGVRKEGDATITWTTLNFGTELTLLNTLSIFSDGFGGGGPATAKAFVMLASTPSDASMLTRSQSLTDPGGTNTFLALNNAATATTNTGSSGTWSSSGTLTDGASEPDPTLGLLNVGTTTIGNDVSSSDGGNGIACRYNLSVTAILRSISIYVATPAGLMNLAVFASVSSSTPGALLVQTGPVSPISGWNSFFVTPTTVTAGDFWIGYTTNDNANGIANYTPSPSYPWAVDLTLPASNTFNNPWVPDLGWPYTDHRLSSYATFDVTGGPGVNTASISWIHI